MSGFGATAVVVGGGAAASSSLAERADGKPGGQREEPEQEHGRNRSAEQELALRRPARRPAGPGRPHDLVVHAR